MSATQVNGKTARTSFTECPLSASGQRQSGENVSHRVSFVCLSSTAKRRERQSQSVLCLPQVNGENVSHSVSFVCLRSTAKRRERQSQNVLCLPQVNGKATRTSVTECPLSASGQRQSDENVIHRVSFVCLRSTTKRRERQSLSVLCLPQHPSALTLAFCY